MLGNVPKERHAPTQPLLDGVRVAAGGVVLELAAVAAGWAACWLGVQWLRRLCYSLAVDGLETDAHHQNPTAGSTWIGVAQPTSAWARRGRT